MPGSVLIVDDHRGFREWARRLLEFHGYTVVGEAGGGAEALASAHRLDPDVVLLDVHLPDMDGFEVARTLVRARVRARIVLVSARDAAEFGHRVADADVDGFIAKPDLSAESLAETLSGGG